MLLGVFICRQCLVQAIFYLLKLFLKPPGSLAAVFPPVLFQSSEGTSL